MTAESPAAGVPCNGTAAVCVLGSGSRGNAVYISDGVTAILVDAGFSAREIDRRLRSRGIDPAGLNAMLLTHEHTDHVKGVERLVRRHRLPVYLTAGTCRAVDPGHVHPGLMVPFACGREFRIGTLVVRPFCISHDAGEPAGFAITAGGIRIGIATDLGQSTALVRDHLQGCRVLILESNHDPDMLMNGPYPWFLKQRIRGRMGHLSNPESCLLLSEVVHAGLEHVILAHLSETNNTPQKALAEAGRVLSGSRVRLTAAEQGVPTPLLPLG
jgi:phosphoribosyl 1,2-cyclic phosphodiesterase